MYYGDVHIAHCHVHSKWINSQEWCGDRCFYFVYEVSTIANATDCHFRPNWDSAQLTHEKVVALAHEKIVSKQTNTASKFRRTSLWPMTFSSYRIVHFLNWEQSTQREKQLKQTTISVSQHLFSHEHDRMNKMQCIWIIYFTFFIIDWSSSLHHLLHTKWSRTKRRANRYNFALFHHARFYFNLENSEWATQWSNSCR